MNLGIFDAQVNFGRSAVGPDCDMGLYLHHMRSKVSHVMLVPTPSHDHLYADGVREVSCMWEAVNGKVRYWLSRSEDGGVRIEENPKSPYVRFNLEVVKQAQLLREETGIQFFVAAKCHPLLDARDSIASLLEFPEVKAIKIHGIATHSTPQHVPSWLPTLSVDYNVPLFIHTDYCDPRKIRTPLDRLMFDNSARAWYDWVKAYGVSAYLAHGLRLDVPLLNAVRGDPTLLIGTGPASLLETERERLHPSSQDYYSTLLQTVGAGTLAFNTDYRWNAWSRDDWNVLDWSSDERLVHAAQQLNFTETCISQMLRQNAIQFFLER